MIPDAMKDLYMARGYSNQHIGIVPSKEAVAISLGWTNREARFDVNKYFSEILNALPAN